MGSEVRNINMHYHGDRVRIVLFMASYFCQFSFITFVFSEVTKQLNNLARKWSQMEQTPFMSLSRSKRTMM